MYKTSLIFILSFISIQLICQERTITFEQISTEHGLSSSKTYDVAQDNKGFLWIGTANGLNRFDGKQFKVYRNNPNDSTSIPVSLIKGIQPMKDNILWLTTREKDL